jgi:hypothetical protein
MYAGCPSAPAALGAAAPAGSATEAGAAALDERSSAVKWTVVSFAGPSLGAAAARGSRIDRRSSQGHHQLMATGSGARRGAQRTAGRAPAGLMQAERPSCITNAP